MTSQQCRGSCWSLRDWCCCSWRRVLFVFLFVEQNVVFCWTSHLQVIKSCWWKRSINARSKNSVYIQLIIFPVDFNINQISRQLIQGCVQTFLCTCAGKYFIPNFMCSLLVGCNVQQQLALDGYSRIVVIETTSSKLPEVFLGNILSFLGRDLLQSESPNLVQCRETIQYRRWRLRKRCCFNVDWKCKNW